MSSEDRHCMAAWLMSVMTRLRWLECLVLAAVRRWPSAPVLWTIRQRYAEALAATERRDRWVAIAKKAFLLMDASNLYSQTFILRTPYEPPTTQFVLEHLRPGDRFVDIGAYQGYFSVLAASVVGEDGKVIAFEANPEPCQYLEQSIVRNGFADRISVVNAALSSEGEGAKEFYLSSRPRNAGMSSFSPTFAGYRDEQAVDAAKSIKVRCLAFDDWLAENPLGAIRIVKIDVEGWDLEVLKGMQSTLEKTPPAYLVVETEPGSEVESFLRGYGYEPKTLSEGKNVAFCHARATGE